MKATEYRQLQLLIESFCKKAEHITGKSVSVLFDGQQIEKDTFVKILPSEVMSIICDKFKVQEKQIRGRSRIQPLIFARHAAAFFIYWYCEKSLSETGIYLDNRDHSSIIYSHHAWRNLIETDVYYETLHEEILHEINLYRNAGGKE